MDDQPSPPTRRRFLQFVLGLLGLGALDSLRRVLAQTRMPPPPPPRGSPSPSPPPPSSPQGGAHIVVVTVTDGAGREWFAKARVGDDPTVAARYLKLVYKDGTEHRGLTAWFYADGVEVGVTRIDCPYDYVNCRLKVTYDGVEVPHAPSSKPDGTLDFWRGCRMPPIRYGKQVEWSATKIDRPLLPSYAWNETQAPFDDSKKDYTFNGMGCATMPGMGSGGERPDIGYMPQWNTAFLLNPSNETWAVVRRADDHCGVWRSVYFSDPDTGSILDRNTAGKLTSYLPPMQVHGWKNNDLVPYGGSYDGDKLIPPEVNARGWPRKVSASPYIPNGAHLTAYALLSAMITGTARDRDHASFWCNFPLFEINPLATAKEGVTSWAPRRFAWCIRNIFLGAYVSAHPSYFEAELNRELAIANPEFIGANKYGIMAKYLGYRGPKGTVAAGWKGVSTWQQYFVSMTMDAIGFKRPEWRPFAKYIAGLPMLFFTRPYATLGTVGTLYVRDPTGQLPGSWDDILLVSIIAYFKCDESEAKAMIHVTSVEEAYKIARSMYARKGEKWIGRYEKEVCDLVGNPLSAQAYPADFAAAVVAAFNVGAPGSAAALRYIENLPTKPEYQLNQKYHLVPRSIS